MALPLVGNFGNIGGVVKDMAKDAVLTTMPGVTTAVDVAQRKIEERTEKTKQKVEASKDVSPKIIKDAKRTIRSIVQPGINIFNPMNVFHNIWYALVDILPIEHSSNKILTDNLEILRDSEQTKDFQAKAMDVFREHTKILDTDMKRMGSRAPIFSFLPFLSGKANAEKEKQLAEKTKYLSDILRSLNEHVSFIKENMVANTVQGHTGFQDARGKYQAELTKKDYDDLKAFSSEVSSDTGKYFKLRNYPPMQEVKAKVDEILQALQPVYDGFSRR